MNSAIARRYAKALLEPASEGQVLDQTRDGLEQLTEALARHSDLSDVCLNPMFSREECWRVLEEVMVRLDCSPLVKRFINLLVAKHRLVYLSEISRHFAELVDEKRGREAVCVRTPREISDRDQAELRSRLEEALGRQVVLSIRYEPFLLAGIAVQVGSQVFDGSVRGRLTELGRTFLCEAQGMPSASSTS